MTTTPISPYGARRCCDSPLDDLIRFKSIVCVLTAILVLTIANDCVAQDIPHDSPDQTASALPRYMHETFPGRSEELIALLLAWDALPQWYSDQPDWLREFHGRVLDEDWPEHLKTAAVALIEGRGSGPAFAVQDDHVIVLFDSTPAYLSQLLEITNHPFSFPDSDDPNALMIINPRRVAEAVDQLAGMLGMLSETSYLEGPEVVWRPATIFGSRFIYYHELGHLVVPDDRELYCAFSVEPVEIPFKEEMCADRFALSMLALETRSSSEFQVAAAAGVAAAMSLVASQEFVREATPRSIKPKFQSGNLVNSLLI